MFCPKCATQNLEGASFCRSCGANISLVPHALTGQLPQSTPSEIAPEGSGRKHGKEVTLDHSFKNIFMGIAFLLVAIALSRSIGRGWWFWMLLPAFSMMGTGIAQYIRLREKEKQSSLSAPPAARAFPDPTNVSRGGLSPRRTDEVMPPVPSVTEGTTRHLGVEAPTRHLDTNDPK